MAKEFTIIVVGKPGPLRNNLAGLLDDAFGGHCEIKQQNSPGYSERWAIWKLHRPGIRSYAGKVGNGSTSYWVRDPREVEDWPTREAAQQFAKTHFRNEYAANELFYEQLFE